jgi:putative membrane protein
MLNRRILVAGAAVAAAVPTIALAQNAQKDAQPNAAGMQFGDAEKEHAQKTLATGAAAMLTSKIALQKASHPMVKMFAQFEVDEQQTVADVIMQTQKGQPSSSMNPPSDKDAQASLDAKGKDMVNKMQQMQAGAEFDRAYIAGQIDGHNELLRIQETYIKSGKNLACMNSAKLARGQIKEHLAMLQHIREQANETTGTGANQKGKR